MLKVLRQFTCVLLLIQVIPSAISDNLNHTKLLNDYCVSSDQCADSNAECDAIKRTCVCMYDSYANSQQKCVKYKKYKQSCETDEECLNGYCNRDRVCVCKPGSLPLGENFEICSPSYQPFNRKKFGERCEFFECDPEMQLFCDFRKTCVCNGGYVYQTGGCVQRAYDWNNKDDNYKFKESKTKDYGSNKDDNNKESKTKDYGNSVSSYGANTGDSDSKFEKNKSLFYVLVISVLVVIGICLCCACCSKLFNVCRSSTSNTTPHQNDINLSNTNNPNFNVSAQPLSGDQQNVVNNSFRVSDLNDTPLAMPVSIPTAPPNSYSIQSGEEKPPSYNETIIHNYKYK